jgi:hypothetical protein
MASNCYVNQFLGQYTFTYYIYYGKVLSYMAIYS